MTCSGTPTNVLRFLVFLFLKRHFLAFKYMSIINKQIKESQKKGEKKGKRVKIKAAIKEKQRNV